MSDFATLNTALSALIAHRRAIEVISHDVANANTAGYTRRTAQLQATGGAVPAMFSQTNRIGDGVDVAGVVRVRDAFLDMRVRSETSTGNADGALATALAGIEQLFPEPSDTGLAAQMSALWSSWSDLASNPGNLSARTSVLQQAATVVDSFHQAATGLTSRRDSVVAEVGTLVGKVNDLADEVADLNRAIKAASVGGVEPADLQDQRDMLLDQLSQYVGIDVRPGIDGGVDVSVGGVLLVAGTETQHLQVAQVNDPALAGLGLQRLEVQWSGDGRPAEIEGGHIAGDLAAVNDAIPAAMTRLDEVAATLVSTVNALHASGQGLDGVTGRTFFDPTDVRAATLAVSADVDGQPSHLAAAAAGAGALDAGIADRLSALGLRADGADARYQSFVTDLGTRVDAAKQRSAVQDSVVQAAVTDRSAVTGVSIDEEMVALVASQHAYSAAARIMTAVDETLDTLINRTGTVGR